MRGEWDAGLRSLASWKAYHGFSLVQGNQASRPAPSSEPGLVTTPSTRASL
jgi:hypothetical protein